MTHLIYSLPASLETYQALGNRIINAWMADFNAMRTQGAAKQIAGFARNPEI